MTQQDFKSPLRRDDPRLRPLSAGLLGPTLRAEEGETIVVTFRNMASGPHSIHAHGIAYGKQSEGGCLFIQLRTLSAWSADVDARVTGSDVYTGLANTTNSLVCLFLK